MIKIGFIGVGSMGKNHLRVALELNQYYNVIGFYDTSKERCEEISNLYGVDAYADVDELIDKVDAVVVATPASTHFEIGIKAANKNKAILMEKPVCIDINEAKELEKTCKNVILVSHVERYNPVVSEVSELLKNEEVIAIEMHRCSPYDKRIFDADVIEDLMIHDIDILINELWPHKIKKFTAYGNNMFSENKIDYANALIEFDDNVVCSVISSRSTQNKIRTINIHTKSGYIHADLLNRTLTITRRTTFSFPNTQQYKQDNIVETLMVPIVEPLKEEYIHFYNCIVDNINPKTNIKNSIKTLELCKEIQDICEGDLHE